MIFVDINDIRFSARYFLATILLFGLFISSTYAQVPITTDSRIRVLVYNPNEVYDLKFYYNYQSFIEFAEDEEIETISTGEAFAWRITPSGKRLFIRPLEVAAHTNMTIITNKRTYNFDIRSGEFTGKGDENLIYTLKFYYPQTDQPMPIPPQIARPSPAFVKAAEQKNSRKIAALQQQSISQQQSTTNTPTPIHSSSNSMLVSPLPALGTEKAIESSKQDIKTNFDSTLKKPELAITKENKPSTTPISNQSFVEKISPKSELQSLEKRSSPAVPTAVDGKPFTEKTLSPTSNKKNFAYKVAKDIDSIKLKKVFDDGAQTYFEFAGNSFFPRISTVDEKGREIPLITKGKDGYLVVQTIERQFTIRIDDKMICVFNGKFGKTSRAAN